MTYQVFVSYARKDDEGGDVSRFYELFRQYLGERLNDHTVELAFFDQQAIAVGHDWSDAIRDGLRCSRAFVSLISPSLVVSEYSGKEFEAFRRRVSLFNARPERVGQSPASLMFPLIWGRPVRNLPAALAALQDSNASLPKAYREEGLAYLQRLDRHRDDYIDTLLKLVDRIATEIEANPMADSATIDALNGIPSAFARPANAPAVITGGPNTVQFVYVAAKPNEIGQIRAADAYEPEGGWFWCPYVPPPENNKTVGQIATSVAGQLILEPNKLPVDAQLSIRISDAASRNNVIAVLVDPWTLRIDDYLRWMQQVDALGQPPHCTILIPTNPNEDAQTKQRHDTFVRAAFPGHEAGSTDLYFNRTIDSPEKLEGWLTAQLPAIKQKITSASDAKREVSGSSAPPTLVGPGGGDPNKTGPLAPPPR